MEKIIRSGEKTFESDFGVKESAMSKAFGFIRKLSEECGILGFRLKIEENYGWGSDGMIFSYHIKYQIIKGRGKSN